MLMGAYSTTRFYAFNHPHAQYFVNRKLLKYDDELLNTTNETYMYREDFCPNFNLSLLHMYYVPFIGLTGLIGNLLAVIVFTFSKLNVRSSSYYLAALSLADLIFLADLLVVYGTYMNWLEIFNEEGWCQAFVYVSNVCSSLSVWLTVAFTVERFIAIEYPLQRPFICTIYRAKTVTTALFIMAIISHFYVFITAGIIRFPDGNVQCEMVQTKFQLMKIINLLDFLTNFLGPFVLITAMNARIATNIYKFGIRLRRSSINSYVMKYSANQVIILNETHVNTSLELKM